MPIGPWIIPAAQGVFALGSQIFGPKKPELPPEPEFFGKAFDEMLARKKQATRAQYGNILGNLRDYYGNLGLLGNPGALSSGATQASIGEGQDILGQVSDATSQEYGARQNFQTNRYLDAYGARNQLDLGMYAARQQAIPDALKSAMKFYIMNKYLGKQNEGGGDDVKKYIMQILSPENIGWEEGRIPKQRPLMPTPGYNPTPAY